MIVTYFPVIGSKMVSVMARPFRLGDLARNADGQLWLNFHTAVTIC